MNQAKTKNATQYKVVVQLTNPSRNSSEKTVYSDFITKAGRTRWATKAAAEKHARNWKSENLMDAWAEPTE